MSPVLTFHIFKNPWSGSWIPRSEYFKDTPLIHKEFISEGTVCTLKGLLKKFVNQSETFQGNKTFTWWKLWYNSVANKERESIKKLSTSNENEYVAEEWAEKWIIQKQNIHYLQNLCFYILATHSLKSNFNIHKTSLHTKSHSILTFCINFLWERKISGAKISSNRHQ